MVLPEPRDSRKGENHPVELPLAAARLAQSPQARIDVAAQFAQRDARHARSHASWQRALQEPGREGLPPRRRTTDAQLRAARQQLRHVGREEGDVARILARGHGRELQLRGPLEAQVLE